MRRYVSVAMCGGRRARAGCIVLLLGALGCGRHDRFEQEQDFLRAPLAQQHERFAQLPPERQVQIYLAAQSREAPDTSYCREIAQTSGASAIPAIAQALRTEQEEFAKRDLLQALRCVSDRHPGSCDAAVLDLARSVAASIENESWKSETRGMVSGLRCSGGAPNGP